MNAPSNTAFPRLQRATVHDAVRLADLAARLFEWTYRGQDDPQALATYIQEKSTPAAMARTLTDPNAVIFMAEAESGLCGYAHLQLESAAPEVVAAHTAELVRLYVDPSWFGQGLGAAHPAELVRLYVDPGRFGRDWVPRCWKRCWQRRSEKGPTSCG